MTIDGRFVVTGETTRYGDVVARRLSNETWQVPKGMVCNDEKSGIEA